MSNKLKSTLYFASFVIAMLAYSFTGSEQVNEFAMEKEPNKIQNKTVATPNATAWIDLQ